MYAAAVYDNIISILAKKLPLFESTFADLSVTSRRIQSWQAYLQKTSTFLKGIVLPYKHLINGASGHG